MIISKCPLRVSLAGGSTDLQSFIDVYGRGSVINFPTNLSTYIFFSESNNDKYKITYSKIETLKNPNKIKNDIAREIINYFDLPPVNIIFNSDIPSTGSGLASSSSYTIALLECVNRYLNLNLSQFEVCKLALKIERIINPLTGYQDTYGCGLAGGLKRLDITNEDISIKYLNFNKTPLDLPSIYSWTKKKCLFSTSTQNQALKSINTLYKRSSASGAKKESSIF